MKYRTKLYIALLIIALLSTALGIVIIVQDTYSWRKEELSSKVISIASTAAALVNVKDVESLTGTLSDENSPAYQNLVEQLRDVRDTNRSLNAYVQYAYILKPNPKNPSQYIFLVDAEKNPQLASSPGDVVPLSEMKELASHRKEKWVPQNYYADPWGVWLTGFVPIRNAEGQYVATLAIDLSAKAIQQQLNKILIMGLIGLSCALLLAFVVSFFLSRQVTLALLSLVKTVNQIGEGNLEAKAELKSHDEFANLGQAINDMVVGLKERERLKMSFARYVSFNVMEKILTSASEINLKGEKKRVTVLFADIRNFTYLAESLSPEQVVSLLNEYFAKMLDIIFKNQGTLDKFIGDGIMVEFGVPIEDEQQEIHALTTAIEMQQGLKALCDAWEKEGKSRIEVGIGINSGPAVVGNVGSEKRMDFTVIGDTVNTASRLEALTKILKVPVLVSETTFSPVKDRFKAKNLGPIELPGKKEKITVYALELDSL